MRMSLQFVHVVSSSIYRGTLSLGPLDYMESTLSTGTSLMERVKGVWLCDSADCTRIIIMLVKFFGDFD